MRIRLLGLLTLLVCLSVRAKTYEEGYFLYSTIDDNTCMVQLKDANSKFPDRKLEIPATVTIDGKTYGVTEIPEEGFKCYSYNATVKEIILPEGLLSIGKGAFANYTQVKEIVIPNSVTTLKTEAFYGCTYINTVTIGSGVKNIPDNTFGRAGSISSLKMLSPVPPTLGKNAFPLPMYITVTVPKGSKQAYQEAWSEIMFQNYIEDDSEIIEVPRPEIKMDENNMVSITCSDNRASIYYTFGTLSPDKSNGTLYEVPFLLTEKTTVRAKAFIDNFQSSEAYANLEPKVQLALPDSLVVFLNGHQAWGADRNMAWHSYPVAADGASSRLGDILGQACVWAEPQGDLLYMFTFDTFSTSPDYYLTTYDRGTLEFVDQQPLPKDFNANDVAVDPITGRIYGVFARNNEYYYGYINLETQTRVNVAKYDLMYNEATVDRVHAFCFSPEGTPYGLTFGGRLVKFDRETGAYSVVGETGWNINYVSCARWDEKSGHILYAFSDQDGQHYFYTINPETAERSKYCDLPGSVSAFFTPYDYVNPQAPAAPQNVALNFNSGSRVGKLSFKAPTVSQNGDEISGELAYRVVRKGKTVTEGKVRAGAMATVDINATMDGNYVCSVVLSNNYGESLRSNASAFAGKDSPDTPVVHAEKVEGGIKITWNKVEKGVNGGYIDPSKIKYNVMRYPGKDVVASELTETSYVDNVETPEEGNVLQYYYTVTAYAGETLSAAGKSNKVVLGYFTPTWTENFSKEENLDNFTIINNSGYVYDEDATSGWCWNNYWRCAGAFYHPYDELDDWLITPPLMMEKGKTYRLSFKAGATPGNRDTYLEVRYGNDNTGEAMSNMLLEKFNVQSKNQKDDWMTSYTVDIVPQEDGIEYIGFHCLSKANQLWLYLDDVSVLEGIIPNAPKVVENLVIVADEKGAPKANISFNLPKETTDGKTINP